MILIVVVISHCLELINLQLLCKASQQTFLGLEDVLKTSSTRLQRNNSTSSETS